ncbi:MAG: TPM domain-containing protein [Opitutae bacterium]|nr:TPM domain-containing protein [Opitutae bacterium]
MVALLVASAALRGAERIPPAPPRYFNDYAGTVSRATADQLNARLEQFERESSNQLLVAIYPRMESNSSVEDYTVRVAQAWKAGQQGRNNGAVLFVFMQEHQLYLQVGYGLEAVLPDATAKRIIEDEIVPRFRAGDRDGGMRAAVNAMIAATKGEYKGTGRTVAQRQRISRNSGIGPLIAFVVIALLFSLIVRAAQRGGPRVYGNPRRRSSPNIWWSGPGGWSGGGGSSGGGSIFGGDGGGGFSGGGGSFGGGGAGGKW